MDAVKEKLTDEWVMVFGKYEGQKLANIPASYLLWAHRTFRHMRSDLKQYIEENMEVLEQEAAKEKKS